DGTNERPPRRDRRRQHLDDRALDRALRRARPRAPERGPPGRRAHHARGADPGHGSRVQPLVRGRPLLRRGHGRPVEVRRQALRVPAPMSIEVALDHPFAGVVLEVVEATGDGPSLDKWLAEQVPATLAGSAVGAVAGFRAMPYPTELLPAIAHQPEAADRRTA